MSTCLLASGAQMCKCDVDPEVLEMVEMEVKLNVGNSEKGKCCTVVHC